MAQLAEAYIHLRPYSISDVKARNLGRFLNSTALRAARSIYDQRVVIDVELEEGSLRGWITVSGILLVYGVIADYKGFKESVGELVHDARSFAEAVYEPFVRKADASKDQVYRFERRLKTPGRLYRLSKHLEKLEGSVTQLSPADVQSELHRARVELQKIESDLTPEEKSQLEGIVQPSKLPPISKWPSEEPEMPKVAIQDDMEQPSLFDANVGFMVPLRRDALQEPKGKIVYQKRTVLEPRPRRKRLEAGVTGRLAGKSRPF